MAKKCKTLKGVRVKSYKRRPPNGQRKTRSVKQHCRKQPK